MDKTDKYFKCYVSYMWGAAWSSGLMRQLDCLRCQGDHGFASRRRRLFILLLSNHIFIDESSLRHSLAIDEKRREEEERMCGRGPATAAGRC